MCFFKHPFFHKIQFVKKNLFHLCSSHDSEKEDDDEEEDFVQGPADGTTRGGSLQQSFHVQREQGVQGVQKVWARSSDLAAPGMFQKMRPCRR